MADPAQCSAILKKLKLISNPKAVAGMARFGINPKNTFGVSIPKLRRMAKDIGSNRRLAQQLWSSGIHEARILASMVDEPARITEAQVERWVRDFDSWDVCDQCCLNLFEETKFAYRKCVEWSFREAEFVKRAGFVLMARLAVSDKKATDRPFERFLRLIKKEASDERNFVKKAVNWALRQIGKRNLHLNQKAVAAARAIQRMDSRSARWVAADALRELTGKAVQARVKARGISCE